MADEKHSWLTWLGINPDLDFSKARWFGSGLAVLFGTLYLALTLCLVVGLIWMVLQIPAVAEEAIYSQTPQSARWFLTSTAALTAVLTAVVALPFTVIKTIYNRRQTEVAEQSHITDQINKAVENLGATRQVGDKQVPNLEVRIGGLLALERVAIANSSNIDLAADINRIVSTYCSLNSKGGAREMENAQIMSEAKRKYEDVAVDIETALRTLQNINAIYCKHPSRRTYTTIRRGNYQNRVIRTFDFEKIRFDSLNFHSAFIGDTKFINCSFTDVNFEDARFDLVEFDSDCWLKGAKFDGTAFRRSTIASIKLEEVSFDNTFGDGSVTFLQSKTQRESQLQPKPPSHWPSKKLSTAEFEWELDRWRSEGTSYVPP